MARTRTSQQYEGRIPKTPRGHHSAPYIPCAPPLWGLSNLKKLKYSHERGHQQNRTAVRVGNYKQTNTLSPLHTSVAVRATAI